MDGVTGVMRYHMKCEFCKLCTFTLTTSVLLVPVQSLPESSLGAHGKGGATKTLHTLHNNIASKNSKTLLTMTNNIALKHSKPLHSSSNYIASKPFLINAKPAPENIKAKTSQLYSPRLISKIVINLLLNGVRSSYIPESMSLSHALISQLQNKRNDKTYRPVISASLGPRSSLPIKWKKSENVLFLLRKRRHADRSHSLDSVTSVEVMPHDDSRNSTSTEYKQSLQANDTETATVGKVAGHPLGNATLLLAERLENELQGLSLNTKNNSINPTIKTNLNENRQKSNKPENTLFTFVQPNAEKNIENTKSAGSLRHIQGFNQPISNRNRQQPKQNYLQNAIENENTDSSQDMAQTGESESAVSTRNQMQDGVKLLLKSMNIALNGNPTDLHHGKPASLAQSNFYRNEGESKINSNVKTKKERQQKDGKLSSGWEALGPLFQIQLGVLQNRGNNLTGTRNNQKSYNAINAKPEMASKLFPNRKIKSMLLEDIQVAPSKTETLNDLYEANSDMESDPSLSPLAAEDVNDATTRDDEADYSSGDEDSNPLEDGTDSISPEESSNPEAPEDASDSMDLEDETSDDDSDSLSSDDSRAPTLDDSSSISSYGMSKSVSSEEATDDLDPDGLFKSMPSDVASNDLTFGETSKSMALDDVSNSHEDPEYRKRRHSRIKDIISAVHDDFGDFEDDDMYDNEDDDDNQVDLNMFRRKKRKTSDNKRINQTGVLDGSLNDDAITGALPYNSEKWTAHHYLPEGKNSGELNKDYNMIVNEQDDKLEDNNHPDNNIEEIPLNVDSKERRAKPRPPGDSNHDVGADASNRKDNDLHNSVDDRLEENGKSLDLKNKLYNKLKKRRRKKKNYIRYYKDIRTGLSHKLNGHIKR